MLSLALLAIAAAAAQTPAPDWQSMGGLVDGRYLDPAGSGLSWDRAAVVRNGDLVQVPLKVELPGANGAYAVFLVEIDCAGGRVRSIRTTNYRSAESRRGVGSGSPNAPFRTIEEGTYDAGLRDRTCPAAP